MKQNRFFLLLILLTSCLASQAQSQKKINEIKRSGDYYYNYYSDIDADTALVRASRYVLMEINFDYHDEYTMADVEPYLEHISLKRDSVTKMFVYVKKADVKLFGQKTDAKSSSKTDTQPSPLSAKTDSVQLPPPDEVEEEKVFTPSEQTSQILALKDMQAAYNYLKAEQLAGRVESFGPIQKMKDLPSCHAILFDAQTQSPVMLLSPEKDGLRTNLSTGEVSSLANHRGYYVMCFKTTK